MRIERPETHLYKRFLGQTAAQSTYLELDCDERVLRAEADPEIGGGVPMAVWHGRRIRYPLPSAYLTAEAIGEIMDVIAPLCERVLSGSGYVCEWDGSNCDGRLDEDATEASQDIDVLLHTYDVDETECIQVRDAAEWYDGSHDDVVEEARGRTDDELEAWLVDTARSDGVLVLEHVSDYIGRVRAEIAEES